MPTKHKDKDYPVPRIDWDEPMLGQIAMAYDILFDELNREHQVATSAQKRDHIDFIRGKLDYVRRLMRNVIEEERKEHQRQLFRPFNDKNGIGVVKVPTDK